MDGMEDAQSKYSLLFFFSLFCFCFIVCLFVSSALLGLGFPVSSKELNAGSSAQQRVALAFRPEEGVCTALF